MSVSGPFSVNPNEQVYDGAQIPMSNVMPVANVATYKGPNDSWATALTRAQAAGTALGLPVYTPPQAPGGPSLTGITLSAYVRVYTSISASGDTTGATDTAAIQAALTGAAPTGDAVLLRPGKYYLNASLVIGPLGTATGEVAAPGLITLSSGGKIGDNGSATAPVEIVAATGFPTGKFMIDYQQTANDYGPAGAVIGGFTLTCNSRGAGIRLQGPRRFHVKDVSISSAAAPSGYTDGATGAFSVTTNGLASAGAWSTFENVSILNAGQHGVYHNGPNQDTFVNFNVMNSANANYFLDTACQATFLGCSAQGSTGLWGWYVIGAQANIFGSNTEVGGPQFSAVQLQGQTAAGVASAVNFIGCQFVATPGAGNGESQASTVSAAFTSGRPHQARFLDCDFIATATTKDFVFVAASCTGFIEFDFCTFTGTPTNVKYNDASGNSVLQFNKCRGINPVGVVTPVVPASGSAVAAQPYDRTFYVSTVAGTTSCSMAIQGGPTITFVASTAQVVAVRVPAGQTVTPTYTGTAPTWVVEGE